MINYINEIEEKEFVFVTLTATNVEGEDLNNEITKFNQAYEKMFKRKEILNINKGCIRKLEITYNKGKLITEEYYNKAEKYCKQNKLKIGDPNPNFNTYHPHFHIIMAVNKSYFTSRDYLKQNRWLELWQQAMKDKNITQVDVRRMNIYEDSEAVSNSDIRKGILEISKYIAKDTDLYFSNKTFDIFYKSLKDRRLFSPSGLFKEHMKELKVFLNEKDSEKREEHYLYPYIPIDEDEKVKFMYKIIYGWGLDKYIDLGTYFLTESEKKRIHDKEGFYDIKDYELLE